MRSASISVLLLFSSCSVAQSVPSAQPLSLEAVLGKLAQDAQLLQHDLPSIVCKETITSQSFKKTKLVEEVRLIAEVHVERDKHGNLAEHYDFKELNGAPYSGPQPKTPFFVEGSVDEAFLFYQPSVQPTFVFTLSPGRLDYKVDKRFNGTLPFVIPPSTHGLALLDANGGITHTERRADSKEAQRARLTDFAAYDFTPTELNGKTYLLTTRNLAESSRGNELRRFDATLSDCRLFHATTKILPGESVVPSPPTQPPLNP